MLEYFNAPDADHDDGPEVGMAARSRHQRAPIDLPGVAPPRQQVGRRAANEGGAVADHPRRFELLTDVLPTFER